MKIWHYVQVSESSSQFSEILNKVLRCQSQFCANLSVCAVRCVFVWVCVCCKTNQGKTGWTGTLNELKSKLCTVTKQGTFYGALS